RLWKASEFESPVDGIGLTIPPAIDSAPTTTMILLFEHPAAAGRCESGKTFFVFPRRILCAVFCTGLPGCESAQSILRPGLNRPGAPASCSRCERPLDTSCWCVASRRVVWPTCVLLPPWPQPSACDGSDANTPCETWDRNGPPSGPLPPGAFSE